MTKSNGGAVSVLQETTMERVRREVFGEITIPDCRTYRIEMRSPDGNIRYYSFRTSDKSVAREEAVLLVKQMVEQFQDERVIWRMAGDKNWSIGSSTPVHKKPSILKRFVEYFFLPEED